MLILRIFVTGYLKYQSPKLIPDVRFFHLDLFEVRILCRIRKLIKHHQNKVVNGILSGWEIMRIPLYQNCFVHIIQYKATWGSEQQPPHVLPKVVQCEPLFMRPWFLSFRRILRSLNYNKSFLICLQVFNLSHSVVPHRFNKSAVLYPATRN